MAAPGGRGDGELDIGQNAECDGGTVAARGRAEGGRREEKQEETGDGRRGLSGHRLT
jgi:hypothetical protein